MVIVVNLSYQDKLTNYNLNIAAHSSLTFKYDPMLSNISFISIKGGSMIGLLWIMSLYKRQVGSSIPTWTSIPIKIWSTSSEINAVICSDKLNVHGIGVILTILCILDWEIKFPWWSNQTQKNTLMKKWRSTICSQAQHFKKASLILLSNLNTSQSIFSINFNTIKHSTGTSRRSQW